MSANYSTAARHRRLNSCLNDTATAAGGSINGQTAGGGKLVILTATGGTVLATVPLPSNPPFTLADISATTVATLGGGTLTATPSNNGVATVAEFRDSGDNTVIGGLTVGVSSGDVQVSTTTISTAVTFQVNSATITTS